MLLFGAWGGLLADRFPKRTLLIVTQDADGAPRAGALGADGGGAVAPWMVLALVFVRGPMNAVDNPTRQSFAIEMVGADRVVNAVSLNNVLIHSARILGPAGAGNPDRHVGGRACFLVNALSFGAMIIALRAWSRASSAPRPPPPAARAPPGGPELRARGRPLCAIPLAMMAVVGTWATTSRSSCRCWRGSASTAAPPPYTVLAVAMGAGAVLGALVAGARGRVGPGLLVVAAFGFGPRR